MSVPAAAMSNMAASSAMALSPIDAFLHTFNNSPYFVGIMMLLLNLGGRFISLEVTKQQEQFLQRPWVRRVLIFTVLFVATRNLWVAFWATVIAILLLGYLFNENSALCIFGSGGASGSKCSNIKPGEDLTPEEKEILQRLMGKQQKYQQAAANTINSSDKSANDEDVLHTDVYAANLTLLRNPQ